MASKHKKKAQPYTSLRQEDRAPDGAPDGAQYWFEGSFYRITPYRVLRWNDAEWVASPRCSTELVRFGARVLRAHLIREDHR